MESCPGWLSSFASNLITYLMNRWLGSWPSCGVSIDSLPHLYPSDPGESCIFHRATFSFIPTGSSTYPFNVSMIFLSGILNELLGNLWNGLMAVNLFTSFCGFILRDCSDQLLMRWLCTFSGNYCCCFYQSLFCNRVNKQVKKLF